MRHHVMWRGLGAIATAALLVTGAGSAAHADPGLTSAERALVYDALIAEGLTAQEADAIADDPQQAQYVVVSSSFEEDATEPVKSKGAGGTQTSRVGTCSGSSRAISRTQVMKNLYGIELVRIKLTTTFSWANGRVTCGYSSRAQQVSSYGALGGWYFVSWPDPVFEGFYSYNGRVNGGIKSETSGYFRLCLNLTARTACIDSATLVARTYGHYDGTYSTGGYTP